MTMLFRKCCSVGFNLKWFTFRIFETFHRIDGVEQQNADEHDDDEKEHGEKAHPEWKCEPGRTVEARFEPFVFHREWLNLKAVQVKRGIDGRRAVHVDEGNG